MALKKKGTPEKISTLTQAELRQLRTLVNKARLAGLEPEQVFPDLKVEKNSK